MSDTESSYEGSGVISVEPNSSSDDLHLTESNPSSHTPSSRSEFSTSDDHFDGNLTVLRPDGYLHHHLELGHAPARFVNPIMANRGNNDEMILPAVRNRIRQEQEQQRQPLQDLLAGELPQQDRAPADQLEVPPPVLDDQQQPQAQRGAEAVPGVDQAPVDPAAGGGDVAAQPAQNLDEAQVGGGAAAGQPPAPQLQALPVHQPQLQPPPAAAGDGGAQGPAVPQPGANAPAGAREPPIQARQPPQVVDPADLGRRLQARLQEPLFAAQLEALLQINGDPGQDNPREGGGANLGPPPRAARGEGPGRFQAGPDVPRDPKRDFPGPPRRPAPPPAGAWDAPGPRAAPRPRERPYAAEPDPRLYDPDLEPDDYERAQDWGEPMFPRNRYPGRDFRAYQDYRRFYDDIPRYYRERERRPPQGQPGLEDLARACHYNEDGELSLRMEAKEKPPKLTIKPLETTESEDFIKLRYDFEAANEGRDFSEKQKKQWLLSLFTGKARDLIRNIRFRITDDRYTTAMLLNELEKRFAGPRGSHQARQELAMMRQGREPISVYSQSYWRAHERAYPDTAYNARQTCYDLQHDFIMSLSDPWVRTLGCTRLGLARTFDELVEHLVRVDTLRQEQKKRGMSTSAIGQLDGSCDLPLQAVDQLASRGVVKCHFCNNKHRLRECKKARAWFSDPSNFKDASAVPPPSNPRPKSKGKKRLQRGANTGQRKKKSKVSAIEGDSDIKAEPEVATGHGAVDALISKNC